MPTRESNYNYMPCCLKGLMMLLLLLCNDNISIKTTTAFVTTKSTQLKSKTRSNITVRRRGIQEWKDMEVSFSNHNIDYEVNGSSPLRPLHILSMEISAKVPLPGETIYLQLAEESALALFEMTMERYEGMFAIGLENDIHGTTTDHRTMLTTVPLLEIHEYARLGNGLGTFCSARCVGKCEIHQVFWPNNHRHPFFALVNQLHDKFHSSQNFAANQVADGIELLLSYLDDNVDDNNEQTIHDDFWAAYEVVLQNDPQDFQIVVEDVQKLGQRGWRELNAMSWAAFSILSSQQKPKQRLMALKTQTILGRLQLARQLLSGIRLPTTTSTPIDRPRVR